MNVSFSCGKNNGKICLLLLHCTHTPTKFSLSLTFLHKIQPCYPTCSLVSPQIHGKLLVIIREIFLLNITGLREAVMQCTEETIHFRDTCLIVQYITLHHNIPLQEHPTLPTTQLQELPSVYPSAKSCWTIFLDHPIQISLKCRTYCMTSTTRV